MAKQIFISYSSNDLHVAERVCTLLEAEGIDCWIAPRDVLPGTIYAEEIIKAIEATDALVLICSRYTDDSVHVRSEVEHAFSRRKVIFPVRMEEVELGKALEYFLASSHWLVAWNIPLEECARQLAESMRKVLVGEDKTSRGRSAIPFHSPVGVEEPATDQPTERRSERPNNLPAQTTRLIGREKDAEAVVQLLKHEDVRLVTLTGPGGTGKTRLSLQVATELIDAYDGGVFFVPLAPITDPALVVSTVARALGVQNVGGRPIVESLENFLKNRHTLLLLDNFEQIISAAPVVAGLLQECSALKVLVTSREVLHLTGEYDYAVPPLTVPERPQNHGAWDANIIDLTQFGAVRLFVERAVATMPDFEVTNENAPAIAGICQRLDGLPLAIELVVARIQILTPLDMLVRLERKLPLLGKGARDLPARQRTLTGTIEWSYDLLDADEKQLFSRLAVFVGGCTLAAAEAVCAGRTEKSPRIDALEGFASLADKSLIRRNRAASGLRFTMLETIHAFAAERLEESGEAEEIRIRHAEHYRALGEGVEVGIRGPEQLQWRDRMRDELDNLRAAVRWLEKSNPNEALQTVLPLWWFWQTEGLAGEGLAWIENMFKAPGIRDATRAQALNRAGLLAATQSKYERATQFGKEGLQLTRSLGDNRETALALALLATTQYLNDDFDEIQNLCEESTVHAEEAGDKWILVLSQRILGVAEARMGNYERANRLLEKCLAISREIGDSANVAYTLRNLGFISLLSGDHKRVAPLCRESLSISKKMEDKWSMARALMSLASAAALQKTEPRRAARLFGVVQKLYHDIGTQVPPSETTLYNKSVAAVREAIGNDQAFDALLQEGRTMNLDQAIDYALEVGAAKDE